MKKWMWLVLLPILCGCAGEEPVFETIGPEAYARVSAPEPEMISVWLPDEAVAQTGATDDRQIYVWEDYELRLETRPGGDLNGTLMALTGQEPEALTVMGYENRGMQLYQTVWSATGEEGVTLGRCMVADDGDYHYCVSLLSPEESDSAELYAELCASFSLGEPDVGK